MGSISLLETSKTTKSNGTEIIIPIKNKFDKTRFQEAIFRQLSYFQNIRYIGFEKPDNEILFENEHCIVIKKSPFTDVHLVIGTVTYPIDFNACGINRWEEEVSNCNIGLKFNIGDLQPTLSRESIFWNEGVKKKVLAKLALARKSIKEKLESCLKVERNYAKWYAAVANQSSKELPNQWRFSKIKTSASFVTDDKVSLPIKNTLAEWFMSANLRTVSPYSSYRSRLKKTNNPIYSTSITSQSELLNLPIYQINTVLSSRIISFLFKTYKTGFIVVNTKDITALSTLELAQFKYYIEETNKWRESLSKFEDIVVPEDEFSDINDTDYKENYKKIVAQRKLEGTFTAKRLRVTDSFSRTPEDCYSWTKYESKFELHKTDTIVYCTQEDGAKAIKVAAMLSYMSRYKSDNYGEINNIKFLKIGLHHVKQFKQMPNAYEVKDVLKLDTPLNSTLGDIVTADKLETSISKYKLLGNFTTVNKKLQDKYDKVFKFILDNTFSRRWQSVELLDEIKTLASTKNLVNKEILGDYEEIVKYFKGIELLSHVQYSTESLPHIVEYLESKNKEIDSKEVINIKKQESSTKELVKN